MQSASKFQSMQILGCPMMCSVTAVNDHICNNTGQATRMYSNPELQNQNSFLGLTILIFSELISNDCVGTCTLFVAQGWQV